MTLTLRPLRAFRAVTAAAVAFALLLPAPALANQAVADNLIQRSDAIIAELTNLRAAGSLDSEAALALIQKEMSPLLNFEQLTKRALGKHWRKTEGPLREEITTAFRELLEKTYAKVLAQFSGQKVELLEVKALPEGKTSVVLKVSGEGKSAEVDYIFSVPEGGGEPLIGDIKVEGISLVANYRRQFSSVIKKQGPEALVGILQKTRGGKVLMAAAFTPQEVSIASLEERIREGSELIPAEGVLKVDLHKLPKCNTLTICLLLALMRQAGERKARVEMVNTSDNMRKLLQLYQINEWWEGNVG